MAARELSIGEEIKLAVHVHVLLLLLLLNRGELAPLPPALLPPSTEEKGGALATPPTLTPTVPRPPPPPPPPKLLDALCSMPWPVLAPLPPPLLPVLGLLVLLELLTGEDMAVCGVVGVAVAVAVVAACEVAKRLREDKRAALRR